MDPIRRDPVMYLLSKWYCDCVSDEGDAFVGYWARMRWGPFALPYAATLYKPAEAVTCERYKIRACPAPTLEGDQLRWRCGRLGARGVWTARAPAIERTLLDSPDGTIVWRCHLPRAEARIDLGDSERLAGLGYAEQLTMSVKPWRLPFDELRWGRFLSAEDALIWIVWLGGEPRQWAFHNGSELRGATVSAERVELPGGQDALELSEAVVLREGRLASTALRAVPGASLWLRGGMKNAYEAKWLARGRFTTAERSRTGWAVHEVVRLR